MFKLKIKRAEITNKAIYSDDERYRYSLTKKWSVDKPKAIFIGINPSDDTELIIDKTVMNLMNYLINGDFGEVESLNLFAYRSKKQSNLIYREDKYEKDNIEYIKIAISTADLIIVGWGRDIETKAKYRSTIREVKEELKDYSDILKCFKDKKGNINCHLIIGYSDECELVEYICK